MFATRVSRVLVFTAASMFILVGCKGHGSSSQIPQTLTNWIWESGSNAAGNLGVYDATTMKTPTSTGLPSGRSDAMAWKDQNGKFWVFSGAGGVNDMWNFDTTSLQWTWVSGAFSTALQASGNYGTQGIAADTNLPGQRLSGATWADTSGNLWMFGGNGVDSNGVTGYLNDLWEFNTTTNLWTWVGGGTGAGNLAADCSANQPNPRGYSATWTNPATGNFYMFGGQGYLSNSSGCAGTNSVGLQNDLWELNPSTAQWTFLGGAKGFSALGVYGTKNIPSASNQPGARQAATTWTDKNGIFWMFGGTGIDWQGSNGLLNDLWKFDPTAGVWTWVNGALAINTLGDYGTNAVVAATNQPGSRWGGLGWADNSGNLWLLGGYGINSSGTVVVLNDLWEYQTSVGQWVWINGSYNGDVSGYYGTLTVLSGSNMPGSRYGAAGWKDASGNFWLFGGEGYDSVGANGHLNDVWKFLP